MASYFNHHLIPLYLILTYIISTTTTATSALNSALASARPQSILLTISKDTSTFQYTTKILQRTPPVPTPLTLDLGTPYLWLNCGRRYVSSTYKPVHCGSPLCAVAKAPICKSCPTPPGPKPGCNNNVCRAVITNPITHKSTPKSSELATDVTQLNSSNGATTVGLVTVPNLLFACAPTSLLGGLAKGVIGVAGFGRTSKASFPTQISSAFRLAQVFALCLPPFSENGFAFVGDGPYNITPAGTGQNVDLRSMLTYTPLISNPVRTSEYFIGVQGIRVGGVDVPINNKNLLSIDSNGNGGATISLLYRYTTMETSIFKGVTTLFDSQVKNASYSNKRVAPIAPFEFCYDTFPSSRVGPSVQSIDFVLPGGVVWTIAPLNSLVRTNDAYCLGFVDGGKNPKSSIVIGGYQIEDNLLQFDRVKSRLGFSSSLVYNRIGCSTFNFTTTG